MTCYFRSRARHKQQVSSNTWVALQRNRRPVSPPGLYLSAARVWKLKCKLSGLSATVTDVAFAPNGLRLVSLSFVCCLVPNTYDSALVNQTVPYPGDTKASCCCCRRFARATGQCVCTKRPMSWVSAALLFLARSRALTYSAHFGRPELVEARRTISSLDRELQLSLVEHKFARSVRASCASSQRFFLQSKETTPFLLVLLKTAARCRMQRFGKSK